jgi:hypothetical protein
MRCWGIVAMLLWPVAARADAIDKFMNWLQGHFHVNSSITSEAFRGGARPGPGTLWMVPGDGTPRQLGTEHRYSLAIFSGSKIVAVRDGQLLQLDPADGTEQGKPCEIGTKDPPAVVFAGKDPGQIGVVTTAGRILEVKLDGERCSSKGVQKLPKDAALANRVRQTLSDLSRRCGERAVASVPQDDATGTRDEIVLFVPKQPNQVLTSTSTLRHHHSPAFSSDCQKVIYLATP